MSIFGKRHYDWLAAFAQENLRAKDIQLLVERLAAESPAFNRATFAKASGLAEYEAGLAQLKRSSTT